VAQAARSSDYSGSFNVLLIIGLVTAFLTAVYSFRAYFRVFHGTQRLPEAAGVHPHDASVSMLWPMAVLAVGSLGLGAALGPTGQLEHYFEHMPYLPSIGHAAHSWSLMIISGLVALAGLGFAWWTIAIRLNSAALGEPVEAIAKAGVNRFYIDEIYSAVFVKPLEGLSRLVALWDINLVDQVWRGVTGMPGWFGSAWRRTQAGGVSNYAAAMAVGLVICLIIVVMQ
jgi:NADH-quinone oxidoreductase subunit L